MDRTIKCNACWQYVVPGDRCIATPCAHFFCELQVDCSVWLRAGQFSQCTCDRTCWATLKLLAYVFAIACTTTLTNLSILDLKACRVLRL
jgi:hypothetical protein